MIIGEIPKQFTILASCDTKYLYEHAKPFVSSCREAGNRVHLHVINADVDAWSYMNQLKIAYPWMSLSSEKTDLSDLNTEQLRTYYACNRFIVANNLLSYGSNGLLITDIDCLIMTHLEQPEADVGLFIRDPLPGTNAWEQAGSRVAAGLVYYGTNARQFAFSVANTIINGDLRWFLDQYALYKAYEANKDRLNILHFLPSDMDWEFVEGSSIWTGKGSRKYDNPKYLDMKSRLDRALPSAQHCLWE